MAMTITKWHVLGLMQKHGGEVSTIPIIETGAIALCDQVVSEGLAEYISNDGKVRITEEGIAALAEHSDELSSTPQELEG